MEKESKIYVSGHTGLVGSAIWRNLRSQGYNNLIGKPLRHLDLTDQQSVSLFFETEKPEYVIIAAARVGGIMANNVYPADFIYENLMIQNNIIHQSYMNGVKKLLFLGSTCIYPKNAPQPLKEEYLLTGTLEPTNEPYAIAKIAGVKMCESYQRQYGCNFFSVMPTNLYGPHDNFDLSTSHVLPAILRKIHQAKYMPDSNVVIWGTGNALREFLYVDDLADACVFLMNNIDAKQLYDTTGQSFINIGTEKEITIRELAFLIKDIVGFKGELIFDNTKPDGTMRKVTDCSCLKKLGWHYSTELEEGIRKTYNWYQE